MLSTITCIAIGAVIGFVGCLLWVSWQDSEFHNDYADEQMEPGINKNRSENKGTVNG